MNFVCIRDVSFAYKTDHAVIKDINWEIPKGEFHSLIGRSGCGKTTLLKVVAGLLTPTVGKISISNTYVSKPSLQTGFVFQAPTLLEWLSVLDNILLPLRINHEINSERIELGLEILSAVGLKDFSRHYPSELSGGQQSRVAIARALITKPVLLLMDEPFAALDAMTREELQIDLLNLCYRRGTTVLFITHDIAEAVYLSDNIALMHDGSIQKNFSINIAKPRGDKIRYQPEFNALCSNIHQTMQTFHSQNEIG